MNAGAAIGGTPGMSQEEALDKTREVIASTMAEVLERARNNDTTTEAAAIALARERMAALA